MARPTSLTDCFSNSTRRISSPRPAGVNFAFLWMFTGYQSTTTKFDYTMASAPTRSSGVVNNEQVYNYTFNYGGCFYHSRSGVSRLPLGSGPPVGYREVTVSYGASGQYGEKRYQFTGYHTASDNVPTYHWPFGRPTSYGWKRGAQVVEETYSSSGTLLAKGHTRFAYRDTDGGGGEPTTTTRFRGVSLNQFQGLYGSTQYVYQFDVVSAWMYAAVDSTITYDQNGNYGVLALREYEYNNPDHAQLSAIKEYNTDKLLRVTSLKYADDFGAGSSGSEAAAIQAMKAGGSAHMPGVVLQRSYRALTWAPGYGYGLNPSGVIDGAELTTFKDFGSGRILPYRRFELDYTTDWDDSSISGSLQFDTEFELVETANAYDASGRIASLIDGGGDTTTYAYGTPNNARLTSVEQGGLTTSIGYTSQGWVQTITDPAGAVRRFEYDQYGRLYRLRNDASALLEEYAYAYSGTSGNGWTFLNRPGFAGDPSV